MSRERQRQIQTAAQAKVHAAWQAAQELEREGRFEEAERTITSAIDHLGAFSQVAYLYELRMARLLAAGDEAGARDAFDRAKHWLFSYASCATSGGEGAALSAERDQRIAALESALGVSAAGAESTDHPSPPQDPDQRAAELAASLERADRLDDAVAVLKSALRGAAFHDGLAEIYHQRMNRLAVSGDRDGAIDAYHRACAAKWRICSGATSGGEGMVLETECRRFEADLERELGFKPMARGPDGRE